MSGPAPGLDTIVKAVWGGEPNEELFSRWCQGFEYSSDEPLALLQFSGGPCAVLAPVQAHLLLKWLFDGGRWPEPGDHWRRCTAEERQELLRRCLLDLLLQSAASNGATTLAVLKDKALNHLPAPYKSPPLPPDNPSPTHQQASDSRLPPSPHRGGEKNDSCEEGTKTSFARLPCEDEVSSSSASYRPVPISAPISCSSGSPSAPSVTSDEVCYRDDSSRTPRALDPSAPEATSLSSPGRTVSPLPIQSVVSSICQRTEDLNTVTGVGATPTKAGATPIGAGATPTTSTVSSDTSGKGRGLQYSVQLHKSIRLVRCLSREDLYRQLLLHYQDLQGPFGVVLFLYSVVLTKGVDVLLSEVEDSSEPLVESTHGHGSQSLVNLLLTGKAVTNVFDSDKDLGGVKLRGVPAQGKIGFLTALEALRYCEVGSFLKNPLFPVWVVGSETHLTVLFSTTRGLVSPETPETVARRKFADFDQEGSGMVPSSTLPKLMEHLGMFTDPDYIQFMTKKLDPDSLGVVLLENFIEEFFPHESSDDCPVSEFLLYHYNGLATLSRKVCFQKGTALSGSKMPQHSSPAPSLLSCLWTKWPGLEAHWEGGTEPRIS